MDVLVPDGSSETFCVGYDGDTTGMFGGTYVTVYGIPLDTVTFSSGFGGTINQPLVAAQVIDGG